MAQNTPALFWASTRSIEFPKQETHDPECIIFCNLCIHASKRLELDMARIVIHPRLFFDEKR